MIWRRCIGGHWKILSGGVIRPYFLSKKIMFWLYVKTGYGGSWAERNLQMSQAATEIQESGLVWIGGDSEAGRKWIYLSYALEV